MRIVVAMSGGVDSSVAAYLLKREKHDVIGMTVKTWPKEECGAEGEKLCCSLEAIQYARSVAEDLGFPHYVTDLSEEFNEHIKKYFEEEYIRGRTPNPCIYCNSVIKFGFLLDKARELDADAIATGHYARITGSAEECRLKEPADKYHDQTYFLYNIQRDKLKYIKFPLGELDKDEVREIAREKGLMPADRKASQDICFTSGGGDYREYLKAKGINAFLPGDILDKSGKVIGRHGGIAAYTVGQRKGLGIGGYAPVYVLKIDTVNNTIIVGSKDEAMNRKIRVVGLNWLVSGLEGRILECSARIRYKGEKSAAKITPEKDSVLIEFDKEQFAATPGQAAVFYNGETVLGGGWIDEVLE